MGFTASDIARMREMVTTLLDAPIEWPDCDAFFASDGTKPIMKTIRVRDLYDEHDEISNIAKARAPLARMFITGASRDLEDLRSQYPHVDTSALDGFDGTRYPERDKIYDALDALDETYHPEFSEEAEARYDAEHTRLNAKLSALPSREEAIMNAGEKILRAIGRESHPELESFLLGKTIEDRITNESDAHKGFMERLFRLDKLLNLRAQLGDARDAATIRRKSDFDFVITTELRLLKESCNSANESLETSNRIVFGGDDKERRPGQSTKYVEVIEAFENRVLEVFQSLQIQVDKIVAIGLGPTSPETARG